MTEFEYKTVQVTTETGSIYTITEDADGRFWLDAVHKVNPESSDINGRSWEIFKPAPWPPVLDVRLYLPSIHFYDMDHPDRPPGGGKHTSRVKEMVFS